MIKEFYDYLNLLINGRNSFVGYKSTKSYKTCCDLDFKDELFYDPYFCTFKDDTYSRISPTKDSKSIKTCSDSINKLSKCFNNLESKLKDSHLMKINIKSLRTKLVEGTIFKLCEDADVKIMLEEKLELNDEINQIGGANKKDAGVANKNVNLDKTIIADNINTKNETINPGNINPNLNTETPKLQKNTNNIVNDLILHETKYTMNLINLIFNNLNGGEKNEINKYSEMNTDFILNKDKTKFLCININDCLYPIVSNFYSLNRSKKNRLIYFYNLSLISTARNEFLLFKKATDLKINGENDEILRKLISNEIFMKKTINLEDNNVNAKTKSNITNNYYDLRKCILINDIGFKKLNLKIFKENDVNFEFIDLNTLFLESGLFLSDLDDISDLGISSEERDLVSTNINIKGVLDVTFSILFMVLSVISIFYTIYDTLKVINHVR